MKSIVTILEGKWMDKLLDNIYKKFFLRDTLSIFMSGFLFLLAMLIIYGDRIENITPNHIVKKILTNKDNELSLFSYVLLIGASYVLGLMINWFRDYSQFRWCYHKQSKKSTYVKNVEEYRENVKKFYENSTEITDDFERMIVMFQVAGNFALTIILCIISMLYLLLFEVTIIIGYVFFAIAIALICFSIFKFTEHITYLEEKSLKK